MRWRGCMRCRCPLDQDFRWGSASFQSTHSCRVTHAELRSRPLFLIWSPDWTCRCLPFYWVISTDQCPQAGITAGEGPVCSLLSRLVGLGGPFLDLQLVVSPELAHTFRLSQGNSLAFSRCDLALGNRAVLGLVSRVSVESGVMDGGHSPVVIELREQASWALQWTCPRPRLPPLLCKKARDLRTSDAWKDLLEEWQVSPVVGRLLPRVPGESAQSLSALIEEGLQDLVLRAGGWIKRPPIRRPAYESQQVRQTRATLRLLGHCSAVLHREEGIGSYSHQLTTLLQQLERRGLSVPDTSRHAVQRWVEATTVALRRDLGDSLRAMRAERVARWRNQVPTLWEERPSVVYRWLAADSPAWGSVPILTMSGAQCTTIDEVDSVVQDFWVHRVWRMHADVDEEERWGAFQRSPFSAFLPNCPFPHDSWSLERVQMVLRQLPEGSAPGLRGIPIAVWKCLPDEFLQRVADLFTLIEDSGNWPDELLHAYVAMIPKAAGGSRPQDQRPITVPDVLYRVWAKGIVLAWAPVLHGDYLGPAALGFRAQAGTLHVAQLLSDLIVVQQWRKQPLWLVSFDVEKCFPSLPWWAIFGVLGQAGVDARTVRCLLRFYEQLRHRFRYGQVDGSEWGMANGLAQGCPASPDLLNILFEPFHRWAAAQGKGVAIAGSRVASTSFADDITLVATSWAEVQFLVAGYQLWCDLLGIKLNLGKTQVWTSEHKGGKPVFLQVGADTISLSTRATFRVVGIELGGNESAATAAHCAPRIAKALLSGKRLAGLDVPAAVAAQLWRATVLAQGLYGSKVRNLTKAQLRPLCMQGRQVVPTKAHLCLSHFGAIEIVGGPPLGACAVRDPRMEVLARRLRWLLILANQSGLVGTVHRVMATTPGPLWWDTTHSLASAVAEMGWTVVRNLASTRASWWPQLEPEPHYRGVVHLKPQDGPPPPDAVWTDGSIRSQGGAAAVQLPSRRQRLCSVSEPHSSTQCELVALSLVAQVGPPPTLVLTDSLCFLQLISSWARRPAAAVLSCVERVEVRHFLAQWADHPHPPTLEKVKAHDTEALRAGVMKALGNELADVLAKEAADAVQFHDSCGVWIKDVSSAISRGWWESRRRDAQRRSWLAQLYPGGLEFDWKSSSHIFCPPTVVGGKFVHLVLPPVIKWVARARAGALATNARRMVTGLGQSPNCPCCPAATEDDAHAVAGCPCTGSADCALETAQLWLSLTNKHGVQAGPLPQDWLHTHLLQLAVGLIPQSLHGFLRPTGDWVVPALLQEFHVRLAERLAEVLRRRETVVGHALQLAGGPVASQAALVPPLAVQARQLTVAELRTAERLRHAAPPTLPPVQAGQKQLAALKRTAGLTLNKWVKEHRYLQAVPVDQGETSVALLLLWETDHGQLYPSQAVELRGRLSSFTKRLKDAVAADDELSTWLTHRQVHMHLSPGLPSTVQLRWGVRIDSAVGEPFLGSWKSHLLGVVSRHQEDMVALAVGEDTPRKRLKREVQPRRGVKRAREGGAPPPPLHTKQARVERLKAAQAAAVVLVAPTSSSSSSSGGSSLPEIAPLGARSLPGVIT